MNVSIGNIEVDACANDKWSKDASCSSTIVGGAGNCGSNSVVIGSTWVGTTELSLSCALYIGGIEAHTCINDESLDEILRGDATVRSTGNSGRNAVGSGGTWVSAT